MPVAALWIFHWAPFIQKAWNGPITSQIALNQNLPLIPFCSPSRHLTHCPIDFSKKKKKKEHCLFFPANNSFICQYFVLTLALYLRSSVFFAVFSWLNLQGTENQFFNSYSLIDTLSPYHYCLLLVEENKLEELITITYILEQSVHIRPRILLIL